MRIIASGIIIDTSDGVARSITERHTYDDGHSWLHSYVTDLSVDVDEIMSQRAANINAELERREIALAEAMNYEIPLTKTEIMRRISSTEWDAFQASADSNVKYCRDVFATIDTPIYRGDAFTQQMFGILQTAGILTAARVAEVLA